MIELEREFSDIDNVYPENEKNNTTTIEKNNTTIIEKNEDSSKKRGIFFKFFNLGNLFNIASFKLSPEQIEKNKISREFDSFISADLYHNALLLIKNGYLPNASQHKKLTKTFDHFTQYANTDQIEKWLSNGWTIDDQQLLNLLFSRELRHSKFFLSLFDINSPYPNNESAGEVKVVLPHLCKAIKNRSVLPEFHEKYLKTWKNEVSSMGIHTLSVVSKHLQLNHAYLFGRIDSMQELVKICKLYDKSLKSILNERHGFLLSSDITDNAMEKNQIIINSLIETYSPKCINNIIKSTQVIFSKEKIEELVIENNKKISEKIDFNTLPMAAKKIIDNLENIYPFISDNYSLLNSTQQFEVENFINKRIPEILNDYFSIPEKFREELKNAANKNSSEIMISALSNLESHLNSIYTDISQQKLSSLSAKEKYTNHFKK